MGASHRIKNFVRSKLRRETGPAPNPRPVHVDQEGRIFEEDGSRFEFPGLEPEKIRASMSDLAEGRGRPLREIIAERGR